MHHDSFSFSLNQITKIEGHAALDVAVKDGKVESCKFWINDFKRFYTKAVEKKPAMAAPQLLSRICGTCSNAHILAALKAIETAMEIQVTNVTTKRRELLNAGMYIRDHALHLFLFVLPDVYHKDSILDFDETDPIQRSMLENLFKLKSAGNNLTILAGGRAVHAPELTLGGFIKALDQSKIPKAIEELKSVRPIAVELVNLFTKVPFKFERNSRYLAIRGSDHFDYLLSHKFQTNDGTMYDDIEYRAHLQHVAIPYSHASGYRFEGNDFMVGSLARVNINKDQLHPNTKRDINDALALFPSNNVYHNNLAQAIELLDSIDYGLDLLANVNFEHAAPVVPTKTTGAGTGLIEAPRGTLYHAAVVTDGLITNYEVIVPTGQNQINIENDLTKLIQENLHLDEAGIQLECEKLIRAYDPCMSCAAHFLKLKIDKS